MVGVVLQISLKIHHHGGPDVFAWPTFAREPPGASICVVQPSSIGLTGVNGVELHTLEWSREGVPMVFVHGFANDAHVWDDIAPIVAPHYRVIALDLRGHGDSGRAPDGRYDAEVLCDDLVCALENLGIERLVLVGHSLGGRVSMHFAGRHADRLAGLVLVDSAPEFDARGTTRIVFDAQKGERTFASIDDYELLLGHQYPVTPPSILSRLARSWLRERSDGRYELKLDADFLTARRGITAEEEERLEAEETKKLWNALEGLSCPVLVVRGAASDLFDPEVADRMVEDVLQNGTLEIIAHAGHSVMLDNPEAFERAFSRFALTDAQ
jgi:pimeloyl-ACP methyl ester carboxylesterase